MNLFENFDFEEFLAYLLPGAALILLLGKAEFGFARELLELGATATDTGHIVLVASTYAGVALVAGHVASIWNRAIVQTSLDLLFGTFVFNHEHTSDKQFFTRDFEAKFSEHFEKVFEQPLVEFGSGDSVEQIVRAKAFKEMPQVMASRDKIVRTRSLCGNFTLPMLFGAGLLFYSSMYWQGIIVLACCVALIAKVYFLSRREFRLICASFIVCR